MPAKYWGLPSMLKTVPSALGTDEDALPPHDGAAEAVETRREVATAKVEVKCFMIRSEPQSLI